MKALAILALIFGSLSIFIPLGGVIIAMFCSVIAMITFRSEPTLSGVTFGINIINTAFLTPSLMLTEVIALGSASASAPTELSGIYWAYVGLHLVMFTIAVVWRLVRGAII